MTRGSLPLIVAERERRDLQRNNLKLLPLSLIYLSQDGKRRKVVEYFHRYHRKIPKDPK